jgi:hypothetical protein
MMQLWIFGSGLLTAGDWLSLFLHFMVLSLLAIGGAITTAPDMQRFIVRDQGWLTDAQFTASVALAQAAPGPNVLFVAVIGFNVGGLAGVYRTPHIFTQVRCIFTHTQPTAPYRGAGRPEAIYAIERMIDLAADEMGLDRVELRRRNMILPAQMPFQTGLDYRYDSGDFPANQAMALETADWAGFAARREAAKARGKLLGIGQTQQRGLGLHETPAARMGPQVRVGHAVAAQQLQGHVAGGARVQLQAGPLQPLEGQIQGQRQHDADAHDHALVGERVDGRAGRQPGHEGHQTHGQDGQPQHGQ